jgi:hypothetical protein
MMWPKLLHIVKLSPAKRSWSSSSLSLLFKAARRAVLPGRSCGEEATAFVGGVICEACTGDVGLRSFCYPHSSTAQRAELMGNFCIFCTNGLTGLQPLYLTYFRLITTMGFSFTALCEPQVELRHGRTLITFNS